VRAIIQGESIMSRTLFTLYLVSSLSGCCMGGTASAPSAPGAATTASGGTTGACDVSSNLSSCRDLSGGAFVLGEQFQRDLCMGTYTSGGACPAPARVGSCDDGAGTITRYYSTGSIPYTLETARSECTAMAGNVFTPG
jgi:hypothetical protein